MEFCCLKNVFINSNTDIVFLGQSFFCWSTDLWNKYLGLSQFIDDINMFEVNNDNNYREANDDGVCVSSVAAAASTANFQQIFSCAKCDRRYSTRSIMLRHMNHECGIAKKYACTTCNKKFRRKWNLEQHLKRIHRTWT